MGNAKPVVLDDAAVDLVATSSMKPGTAADLGPLLLEAPLPFSNTWFEYEEELEGEEAGTRRTGVLVRGTDKGVFACSFHSTAEHLLAEPIVFMSFGADGQSDMVLNPHTAPALMEPFQGSQDERVSQLFGAALPQSAWAIVTAVGTMHLIATKGGPLEKVEEPMFSRPERRRMERDKSLEKGAAPTITRIRLNEQGRLHLQAIDEEEGGVGGTRRRAHRVRGHFMRTATGSNWRRAHVRGLGPVNETVRVVRAKGSDPHS